MSFQAILSTIATIISIVGGVIGIISALSKEPALYSLTLCYLECCLFSSAYSLDYSGAPCTTNFARARDYFLIFCKNSYENGRENDERAMFTNGVMVVDCQEQNTYFSVNPPAECGLIS